MENSNRSDFCIGLMLFCVGLMVYTVSDLPIAYKQALHK